MVDEAGDAGPQLDRDGDASTASAQLWRLALLFTLCAVCFFPLIFGAFLTFFGSEVEAENAKQVVEHPTILRLMLTGIGITEVALGIALLRWGRHVSGQTPGRRGDFARVFAWVGVAGGCTQFVGWCVAWFRDAESLGADVTGSLTFYFNGAGGLALSLTFITFGWLMIRGAMPTWLGVVWIACGLLYWLGLLPLWFFVGALAFGAWGLIAFRPGRDGPLRTSALPS